MSTLQIERREYYFWLVIACLVGIGVGTVATGLVSVALCQMREAAEYSKTAHATKAVIVDLDETLTKGDCKLAAKKASLFRKRWQEWMDERAYPASWFQEITNLSH
jgi:hypothetical protein